MATHPLISPLSTPQPTTTVEPPDRRFDHPAAIVCGLLFLAALAIGLLHQVPGFGVETDFAGGFAPAARDLLHGLPYLYPYHPPGYAALLAATSLITRDFFLAGKLLGALSGTLLAWFGYLLLRDLYSSRVAFAATILLAVATVPYAYIASSDLPDAAVIAAGFLILFRPGRFTAGRAAALGLIAGLAYLIRSSGIIVLIGAVAVLLLIDPERRRVGARLRSAGVVIALFLVAIAPVYIYNLATLGHFFAPTAYAQIGPDLDPTVDRSTLTGTSAVIGSEAVAETILQHPVAAANRYTRNVLYYYPPRVAQGLLGFPLVLFAGAGLLVIVAR
ncbi:MAG TPA: glycosyltransferase family 39 protein, partial [Gemmatimonadales bacterium]|nr:glycosyltransferase family 39 protein [Gemmatimonadales bacterium]